MGVPLFDPATPLAGLRRRLGEAIDEVLDRGQFILGPEVAAFEHELAALPRRRARVGVANGTEALTIALRALGVGPGDEVVVPSFTFYASAEAIPPTGARPVFCDVDPRHVLRHAGDRAGGAHAAHEGGDRRRPVRQRRAGARDRGARRAGRRGRRAGRRLDGAGRAAGRARHARDVLVLPVEEPRRASATAARSRPPTRRSPSACACCASTARATRSATSEVGYNSRLDELQAAILRVQLPELDALGDAPPRAPARTTRRRGLGELVGAAGAPPRAPPAWHLYVSATSAPTTLAARAEARPASASRAYYRTPVHRQPAMARVRAGVELPGTDEPARTHLAIPMTAALRRDAGRRGRRRAVRDARLDRPDQLAPTCSSCGR